MYIDWINREIEDENTWTERVGAEGTSKILKYYRMGR